MAAAMAAGASRGSFNDTASKGHASICTLRVGRQLLHKSTRKGRDGLHSLLYHCVHRVSAARRREDAYSEWIRCGAEAPMRSSVHHVRVHAVHVHINRRTDRAVVAICKLELVRAQVLRRCGIHELMRQRVALLLVKSFDERFDLSTCALLVLR